jgi:short-subunit dehydrogenase
MESSPVVLITGASSGIGEKTAFTLGSEGYRLILAARRMDRLDQIVSKITQFGGEAIAVSLDLAEKDQIIDVVNAAYDKFGKIDILVNNAGSAKHVWLDELSLEDDIQNQIQVNLIGMIQLTRMVLPGMLEAGRGQIIHVSSISSWVGIPTYTIYSVGKFGARGFMASLRRELRGTGVVVSEVFPGPVDTEFAVDPKVNWKTQSVAPAFALVTPQAVANSILRMIRRRREKAVLPWFMGLVIWANAHFPKFVSWVLSQYFFNRDGVRYAWRQKSD